MRKTYAKISVWELAKTEEKVRNNRSNYVIIKNCKHMKLDPLKHLRQQESLGDWTTRVRTHAIAFNKSELWIREKVNILDHDYLEEE